ncbi:MAG TPA: dTDP-4-dehydrorhamnose 3,5-epimerase family protein [Ilumatobacteraceae bacterium]|nr:dTDP-4-dehydrorhamnose 3,5-epimerase family protein [Ilumatobacteraceae bacterium]
MEAVAELTRGPARETAIPGVVVFAPQPITDDRGWFSRTLDLAWLEEAGLETRFVHHNQSRSRRGVVRGLHVRAGQGEVKLVRCARGAIVDHVVDVRPWSPVFGRVERFELDDDSLEQLYLPPFVAHGFQVVSDVADVCYLHSRPYEAGAELALAWDDPALGISWPVVPAIVSDRDASAPRLADLDLGGAFVRAAPSDGQGEIRRGIGTGT